METELTLEGYPGGMFSGRSIKRSCPICGPEERDQMWMETRKTQNDNIEAEGIAWCPCGAIFYYSTTNRYEEQLKRRIDLGRIDKVLQEGRKVEE